MWKRDIFIHGILIILQLFSVFIWLSMSIFLWINVTLFQFLKAGFDHQVSQFCGSEISRTIFFWWNHCLFWLIWVKNNYYEFSCARTVVIFHTFCKKTHTTVALDFQGKKLIFYWNKCQLLRTSYLAWKKKICARNILLEYKIDVNYFFCSSLSIINIKQVLTWVHCLLW